MVDLWRGVACVETGGHCGDYCGIVRKPKAELMTRRRSEKRGFPRFFLYLNGRSRYVIGALNN